jgi:alkylation response protein AidB-like acyl-CoA dehydrogenase
MLQETFVALPRALPGTFPAAGFDVPPALGIQSIPFPEGANGYQRVSVHKTKQMELSAARWREGGQSSLHGHGDSAATYTVLSGAIEDERYIPEGGAYRYEKCLLRAGERSYLPPGSYHRVRALEESVTLHCYSPAPDNPVAEVPPETLRQLDEARQKQTEPEVPPRRPCRGPAAKPSLVETVRERLDGWAEREKEANLEGLLHLPRLTVREFKDSGVLAAPMPEALGGWDASLLEAATALRLVARRAPATALALVMPLGNAATTRIPGAALPPPLRPALGEGARWIAEKVRQGAILAVANSEPGSGGDLATTKTAAVRGGDGVYRLTGRKSFATFGRDADYFLCAARRTDGGAGPGVVDGFFVARDARGLTVDDRWDPVGMRPTASVGLTLEGAAAEALLGYPGCLEGVNARHWSTVLFAAVFLGVGEGALREGVRQTAADAVWARGAWADCALKLEAAAGFVEAVARDERWPLPAEAQERTRRAKTFVARTAVETATHAAMVSGGRCYTPQHPVFRYLCDALAAPLLRPPLPQAMDAVVQQLFPPAAPARRAAA